MDYKSTFIFILFFLLFQNSFSSSSEENNIYSQDELMKKLRFLGTYACDECQKNCDTITSFGTSERGDCYDACNKVFDCKLKYLSLTALMLIIFLGGLLPFLILITILIICCCCYCRKKNLISQDPNLVNKSMQNYPSISNITNENFAYPLRVSNPNAIRRLTNFSINQLATQNQSFGSFVPNYGKKFDPYRQEFVLKS